jgi:hypothetical protein
VTTVDAGRVLAAPWLVIGWGGPPVAVGAGRRCEHMAMVIEFPSERRERHRKTA